MSNHTDMPDKYWGDSYDIHPIQTQYKGKRKRGGAAEGRATSFVVPANVRHLFCGSGRADVVAVNTFLLRLRKSGQTVGRKNSRLDERPSDVVARATFGKQLQHFQHFDLSKATTIKG